MFYIFILHVYSKNLIQRECKGLNVFLAIYVKIQTKFSQRGSHGFYFSELGNIPFPLYRITLDFKQFHCNDCVRYIMKQHRINRHTSVNWTLWFSCFEQFYINFNYFLESIVICNKYSVTRLGVDSLVLENNRCLFFGCIVFNLCI